MTRNIIFILWLKCLIILWWINYIFIILMQRKISQASMVKSFWKELWIINKLDVLRSFLLFGFFLIYDLFTCFHVFEYFFLFFPSFTVPTGYFEKKWGFSVAFLNNNKKKWREETPDLVSLLLCFIQTTNLWIYQIFHNSILLKSSRYKEPVPSLWCIQSTIWQHSAIIHTVIPYQSIISVI